MDISNRTSTPNIYVNGHLVQKLKSPDTQTCTQTKMVASA